MPANKRIWYVGEDLDAYDLALKLVNHSWCLCNGFRCGPTIWLNDAFSEDGAQEYAVIRVRDMCQIESVTVSWVEGVARMKEMIEKICEDVDKYLPFTSYFSAVSIETAEEHRQRTCHLCA